MARIIDIERAAGRVCIIFPFDRSLLPVVRSLPDRRFDPNTKRWYAPLEHVAQVVERLGAHGFELSAELRAYCEQNGALGAVADAAQAAPAQGGGRLVVPEDTYSISQLNEDARYALRQHFSQEIWVVGEVQGYERNRPGGHAYFELVERLAAGEDPVARIRLVMFSEARQRIEAALAAAPEAIRLRDGLAVRLCGRLDIYPQTGSYQLVAREVDPGYTSGEIYQNRERVLAALEAQGIRGRNQALAWPVCPLRVGLITSFGSDAYNDFVHELERTGLGFEVQVHHAMVQGAQAEASVLRALRYFAAHADEFDVVAVVRGGGSRSDLAYFDTEAIGRAVCEHPLKIIVGVGHQRDQCVLDFVGESHKTPTAAAQALGARVQAYLAGAEACFSQLLGRARAQNDAAIQQLLRGSIRLERAVDECVRVAARRLERAREAIMVGARERLARAERRVDRLGRAIPTVALSRLEIQAQQVDFARAQVSTHRLRRHFQGQSQRLDGLSVRLGRAGNRATRAEHTRLDAHAQRLRLLDPQRVLERGFAILWSEQGVVLDPADVPAGARMRVRVARGQMQVRREVEDE